MIRTLAALLRYWRNGDSRPTAPPLGSRGRVSPSLDDRPAAAPVVEGDRPVLLCSQGCGRPGTCTWECDSELIRMCTICCPYCNPGGDLEGQQRRRRMQVGAVVR